jgi:hypothetical protein
MAKQVWPCHLPSSPSSHRSLKPRALPGGGRSSFQSTLSHAEFAFVKQIRAGPTPLPILMVCRRPVRAPGRGPRPPLAVESMDVQKAVAGIETVPRWPSLTCAPNRMLGRQHFHSVLGDACCAVLIRVTLGKGDKRKVDGQEQFRPFGFVGVAVLLGELLQRARARGRRSSAAAEHGEDGQARSQPRCKECFAEAERVHGGGAGHYPSFPYPPGAMPAPAPSGMRTKGRVRRPNLPQATSEVQGQKHACRPVSPATAESFRMLLRVA